MKNKANALLYSAAARFLLTSRSSEMVSLVPLPLGSDIQGLIPSPMTKMLEILQTSNERMMVLKR